MSGLIRNSLQGLFDPVTKAIRGLLDGSGNEVGGPAYILAQSAVPSILPSSGSSNATGLITFTTALPYSLASGQPAFVYLPAGVVTAGSQGSGAGLYAVTGTASATVVQITGTGIVTANGAYTQTTGADLTLATVTVPGGAMGANGSIRSANAWTIANTAGAKTKSVKLSGTTLSSRTAATQAGLRGVVSMWNRAAQNNNIVESALLNAPFGDGAVGTPTAIDTSVNQNLTFTAQIAVATDYVILEGYTVEVLPAA